MLNKNKIRMMALISSSALTVIPVAQLVSCAEQKPDNKYQIGEHKFSNKFDLNNYIQSQTSQKTTMSVASNSRWKLEGVSRTFSDPREIGKYIMDNNIQRMTANITLDVENRNNLLSDYYASIPSNSLIPLDTNEDNQILNDKKGMAIAYKGYNDQIYFVRADSPKSEIEEIKNTAKKSWMQFHSAYKFNGIYFKNIEDLEYYLRNFMYQNTTDTSKELISNPQVNIPVSITDSGIDKKVHAQSFTLPRNIDGSVDDEKLKSIIKKIVKGNSTKALYSNDENDSMLLDLENISGDSMISEYINYWNVGHQDQESHYVIDIKSNSRGTLYGDYFVQSPTDMGQTSTLTDKKSGIMNKSGDNATWKKISKPSDGDFQNSYDLDGKMLGSIITNVIKKHFSVETEKDDKDKEDEDEKNKEEDIKNVGFFDVLLNEGKLDEFVSYINSISSGYDMAYKNLGTEIIKINDTLLSGKQYNAFYSLPILRNWLISRLLENRVSQVELEKSNRYFIDIADKIGAKINLELEKFTVAGHEVDLNLWYGFDNHSNNLYTDPRVILNNISEMSKNIIRVATSTSSYISKYLYYEPLNILQENSREGIRDNNYKKIELLGFHGGINGRPAITFKDLILTSSNSNVDELNQLQVKFKKHLNNYYEDHFFGEKNRKFVEYNKIISSIWQYQKEYRKLYNERYPQTDQNEWIDSNSSEWIDSNSSEWIDSNDPDYIIDNKLNQISEKLEELVEESKDIKKEIDNIYSNELKQSKVDGNELTYYDKKLIRHNGEFSRIMNITGAAKSVIDVMQNLLELKDAFEKYVKVFAAFNFALAAFDIVTTLLDWIIPKYKTIYYVYTNPSGKKYYWDGGEISTQFMGLVSNEIHGIDELELLNPIQVTVPHLTSRSDHNSGTASNFYFNGKFYNDPSDIKYKVIDYLRTNNLSTDELKWIFKKNVVIKNNFYDGTSWENENDLNGIVNEIVKKIIDSNTGELIAGSKYLKKIYTTPDGILTGDKNIAIDEYVKSIIGNIKPTYIFQRPSMYNDKLHSVTYKIPYPYFSLASNKVIYRPENEVDNYYSIQYEYNNNLKNDDTTFDNYKPDFKINVKSIISHGLNTLIQKFDVEEKLVPYREVLGKSKFSNLNTLNNIKNIYKAKSPLGMVKYFLHINAAILWLKNEYNTTLSIEGPISNEFIYHSEVDGKDHHFDSITEQIKWIMENEVKLLGRG